MPSPNGRRMKLAEMRAQATEALGTEPGIELELDNGDVVSVPHPMFLDDDAQTLVDEAEGSIATARAILGAEQHARLIAGGGRSADVMLAWRVMAEDLKAPKLPR